MPSRLALVKPRPGSRAALAQQLRAEMREEPIRGPWPGYVPDVEPGLVPYSAMVGSSFGLVSRGETLVPDIGWSRAEVAASVSLPLGDNGAGTGTIGAATTRVQAISHLGFFNRQPTTDNEIVAITRDAGGANENTNVFRMPSTVVWATVPPRNGYAAPTYTPWSLGADDFVDNATLATGFNVTTAGYYAGAAARGVVGQPVFFFVNENNNVACWPSYRAGVVTEYDYPIEAIGTLTGFKAATCAALEGRMCYGNVTYGGATYPQRMWHSAIGDGSAVGTAIIGAGFVDAPEMAGQMLRLLRLGDGLVGYFDSGIVIYTRTYNPLSPFNAPQYITAQVSALSKRSVCQIDRDRHMIIAEQGWYMLDSNGLTELGLIAGQGGSVRKWQDTFYASTNLQKKQHISTVFDSTHHLVEISFPSTGSDVADTSWLYDTLADRVFPAAAYGSQAVHSQLVASSIVEPGLTWGGAVGVWGTFPGSWASYAARKGFQSRYHGDRSGFVYVRDESQGFARQVPVGAGAVQPGYAFVSPQRAVVAPAEWAEANRFEVEYVNVGGSDATLTVEVDSRSATGVRSLQVAPAGKAGVAFLPVAGLGGTHHGVAVSGTAPVALRGMRYVVVPTKGERKGNA